jgi:hypothetical protein
MKKTLMQAISDRRRILGNQLAYVTEIDEAYELKAAKKSSQCPYAYEEQLEQLNRPISRFDSIDLTNSSKGPSNRGHSKNQRQRSDLEIEALARDVLTQIWKKRESLFPDARTLRPIDFVDPDTALRMYGYTVQTVGALGQHALESNRLANVAGILDAPSRQVLLSSGFPSNVRNYTAAHELGHVVMHEFVAVHRDKPLDAIRQGVNPQEREADKFAAYFLMPSKLVRTAFEAVFGVGPFVLNEETRFALGGSIPGHANNWHPKNLRELSSALSVADRFNGQTFVSLVNQFRVSKTAMAIRLEELGLVAL